MRHEIVGRCYDGIVNPDRTRSGSGTHNGRRVLIEGAIGWHISQCNGSEIEFEVAPVLAGMVLPCADRLWNENKVGWRNGLGDPCSASPGFVEFLGIANECRKIIGRRPEQLGLEACTLPRIAFLGVITVTLKMIARYANGELVRDDRHVQFADEMAQIVIAKFCGTFDADFTGVGLIGMNHDYARGRTASIKCALWPA